MTSFSKMAPALVNIRTFNQELNNKKHVLYLLWWMPHDDNGDLHKGFDWYDGCLIGAYSNRVNAEDACRKVR
jgi:hypothetical protein